MNKYQEALDRMYDNYVYGAKQKEDSYFKLQELVDRATPKKTIANHIYGLGGISKTNCPLCRMPQRKALHPVEKLVNPEYCPHCGQALDWSKDEI